MENNEPVKLTAEKKDSLLFVVHRSFSFRLQLAVPLLTLPKDVSLRALKGRKMCGPSVLSLPVASVEVVTVDASFFSYLLCSGCFVPDRTGIMHGVHFFPSL